MASRDKGKLPNLKICVDNTKDAESEDEEEDVKDIHILVQSNETKKKAPAGSGSSSSGSESDNGSSGSNSSDSSSGSDSEQSDAESVEFNVRISGLTKDNQSKKRPELSKRYENKTGNFVTGIDLSSKEALEKKDERAKRFGLKPTDNRTEVDREALLKSLGIKQEDIDKGERGIRLEAIHMRGTDNMNTQDIFQYFNEFGPGRIEWIDDTSCNVVWFDPMTAARALSTLSKDYDSLTAKDKPTEPTTDKPEDSTSISDTNTAGETTDKSPVEEMEVDNVLDLNADSDDEAGDEKMADAKQIDKEKDNKETDSKESLDEEKKEDGKVSEENPTEEEEDGNAAMDTVEEKENHNRNKKINWPPGKWRLGQSTSKAKFIFLRYATKADKKIMGAEQKSKYYIKHGNPNYGGQKGLISGSRKRKIRAKRNYEEYEKVKNAGPEDNDRETDSEEEIIEKPKELFTEKNKHKEPLPSTEDIDNLDMEAELQQLLGPPVKKRSMRMYADDIEDAQRISSRSRITTGGLTIVADGRTGIESRLGREVDTDTRDARFKITDARDKLSGTKNRRSYSPPRRSGSDLRSKLKNRQSDSTPHLSSIKIEVFE